MDEKDSEKDSEKDDDKADDGDEKSKDPEGDVDIVDKKSDEEKGADKDEKTAADEDDAKHAKTAKPNLSHLAATLEVHTEIAQYEILQFDLCVTGYNRF